MLKDLYRTNDKYKNKGLVNVIKSGLIDVKNEIKNISEEKKEIEKPNEIINIVVNKQNQQGQGLKILTPEQILSRVSIIKAENNSQKPINEIWQLLYSLYRSKKITKTIYNNLIIII